MNKSRMYELYNMTSKFTIVLKKELRIIPTNTLLMLYKGTSGGKGLSRTVIGSTAALEVRDRPLQQSTTIGRKLHSSQRGYCVAWNKGSCTKENCTYKHETPPKKTRKPSRGRSTSREGKDKSKITRKYWKAGRCKRGSDCEFSHAGKQKPRKATPARSGSRSSRGSDKKDKRKKDKRGKRDKSGRRSGSDGSRKSKGSKGSGGSNRSSPRVTPAAVCLVVSMLASSVEGLATGNGWPSIACPAKIKVKFESKPNITEYRTSGSLYPYEVERKSPSKFYPIEFAMSPNPSAIQDSILSAKMLAGAVQNELQGFKAKCRYMCKSTIGCDHCIPKTLYATPAASEQQVEHYLLSGEDWIADTGSAQDLATKYDIPDRYQLLMERVRHTCKVR